MRSAFLVCATLSAGYAEAATISVQSAGPQQPAIVIVQGPLHATDGDRFFAKTAPLGAALVRFQSDGGSVLTGIQIGETIRLKDFHTVVPAGARCASACMLAWVGGTRRFMGRGARIGVHAASDPRSGEPSRVANALVGAYLSRMGLPYSAVILIAQAAPGSVAWLSFADAKRLGIEVTLLGPPGAKRESATPMRVGAAPAPLTPVRRAAARKSPGRPSLRAESSGAKRRRHGGTCGRNSRDRRSPLRTPHR
jgi:hypothetical protein